MEWVETTAKSLDEAKDLALDQLGVAADEAEFEVLEEPRSGLFGRTRGEARVRARVMPAAVRPKQERRDRGRSKAKGDGTTARGKGNKNAAAAREPQQARPKSDQTGSDDTTDDGPKGGSKDGTKQNARQGERSNKQANRPQRSKQQKESKRMDAQDERSESPVSPQEVGDAAVAFMGGLADAFGTETSTELDVDGTTLEVRVVGTELGLMVGPGGRTLIAVQDLARVASQRRLGDHDTRLRIDVAGYRERRQLALGEFARQVAETVRTEGESRSLEPMTSADRKVVHDVLNDEDGVTTRSVGEDPDRRIVVEPA